MRSSDGSSSFAARAYLGWARRFLTSHADTLSGGFDVHVWPLAEQTEAFQAAGVDDLDGVTGQMTRAIAALPAEDDAEARRIAERYTSKHIETDVLA